MFFRAAGKPAAKHAYLLSLSDPASPLLEAYRRLYKKVSYFQQERDVRSLGVTSATVGEGKTLTSINLALAMAEDVKNRVALVDCDLRRPKIASYLGLSSRRGLADVIQSGADPREVTVPAAPDRPNLQVLPLGRIRGNLEREIHALLHEKKLAPLLASLREEFACIVVDTPPVLPVVDTQYLADLLDGLLLVIRAGKTPRDLVQNAVETLEGKNLIGTVVNGVDRQLSSRYSYDGYYYQYRPHAGSESS